MPLALFVLAALALVGLALFATDQAQASDAPAFAPAGQGSADALLAPLVALVIPAADPQVAAAAPDPGAGAGLYASLGVELKALWSPPTAAAPYMDAIVAAEMANGLPQGLLARTIYEESRFRPDIIDGTVKSSAGAAGIAQFMPATAAAAGIDPLDPFQAIPAAARELRAMFNKFGSWPEALAAYNWGPGNLGRKGVGAEPAETRRYVKAIAGDVGLL